MIKQTVASHADEPDTRTIRLNTELGIGRDDRCIALPPLSISTPVAISSYGMTRLRGKP